MFPINYIICSNQINSGINDKVFKIVEINPPNNLYIAKIYEHRKRNEYEYEKNILSNFSTENNNLQNDYLIKLKNIEVRLEYNDNFHIDSNLLIFDYLSHGTLCEYLYKMPNINLIKEVYVKLIGYKLLKGLKKLHEKNICHNKIDIKNIMFDNDFNPIIIHFSEASFIHDNNFNKDFIGLGMVLAKLITSGQFKAIGFDKKTKKFIIKSHNKSNSGKKNLLEESAFWKIFELNNQIKISDEFRNFFDILVKSKNILDINDLINNEWFKDISNNQTEIENNLKTEFETNYNRILKLENTFTQNINISSIINISLGQEINENNITNGNLFFNREYKKNSFNRSRSLEEDEEINFENKKIKIIKNEPQDIQSNYIEININGNNYICRNVLNKFFLDFQNKIKQLENDSNMKVIIEQDENSWAFNVTFEENDYCKENDKDDEIEYIDEDINDCDSIPLIIKIELYEKEKEIFTSNNKYYLIFNYIQGDVADYYEYLKNIKSFAKPLLNI